MFYIFQNWKMKRMFAICIVIFASLILQSSVWAADGKALVNKHKCGDCHKMQGPAATTIAEVMKRKAPDLFFAGSKFNKDWVVKFIQNPTQLRPAGTVYVNYIKTEGNQDVVKNVPKCASKLSADEANAVAEYLMTLKDANMKTGVFKAGKFSKARARRIVTKQEACNACHRFPKKGGGVSCPTFEGIGSRLNPDWIYSFVKDPKYWDPKIWMAKSEFDDATLQLIVNYLTSFK